jgi:hypothetical protein
LLVLLVNVPLEPGAVYPFEPKKLSEALPHTLFVNMRVGQDADRSWTIGYFAYVLWHTIRAI